MMIPDKNFKLKKTFKRMISLMKGGKADRDHYKSMMIQAQLHEESARRAALKSKDPIQKGSKDAE